MNHYATLGVSHGADEKEIKRAYRRMASKHHPDKGGDPEQFKRIQEAYEALTNPQPDWQTFSYGPFDQQAQHFTHRQQHVQRNPDKIVEVSVSLLQAQNGTDILIETNGRREVVMISPGTKDGDRIRIKGKGFDRFKNALPGDLIIRVAIQCPDNMSLKGDDIYQRLDINVIDAMTGGTLSVDHYSGKQLNVKIPAGTQQGSKLRIKGWGLSNNSNLYIIVNLQVPTITETSHIDLLNRIKQEAINE